MNLDFNKNGYIIYKNKIPTDFLHKAQDITLSLKNKIVDENLKGLKKDSGFPTYWEGLDMASSYSNELYEMYTSQLMYDIAKDLLETDTIFLFNDQIVVKLPNEEFKFEIHTDNEYGPNNEMALNGEFKTITCCWVLDDFTDENGPVIVYNLDTKEWDKLDTKAGDIVVWDGNTPHYSEENKSDKPRRVWVLVYSTKNLTHITKKSNMFERFYGDIFTPGNAIKPTKSKHIF